MAVGPMDGSIWRSYRLIIEDDGAPPFFLEPDSPLEWASHFSACGFSESTRYFSAINSDLNREDPAARRARGYMNEQGIHIRTIDTDDLQRELDRIYALSATCFQQSPFYTQLDPRDFNDIYLRLGSVIDSRLVLMAEHQDKTVGFIFALPDLLQAQCGEKIDRVIIKTVAVMPGRPFAGTGVVLIDAIRERAHALGYRHIIHALMREGGVSGNISARTAYPFRRYALYEKLLDGSETDS